MIEAIDVNPGFYVVAGLATKWRAVGATLRLQVLELPVMRILMTSSASHIIPAEWEDLVGSARGTYLVTFIATYGNVRSQQWVSRLAVLGNGVGGHVKVFDGMTVLAAIMVGLASELLVVRVLMTIKAGRKLDHIYSVLARREVALVALHGGMLAF